jgi:integrase
MKMNLNHCRGGQKCRNCKSDLTRLENVRYRVMVRVKDPETKTGWKTKTKLVGTLEEARKVEAKLLSRLWSGDDEEEASLSTPRGGMVGSVWSQYLEHAKHRKRSWKADVTRYNNHIKPQIGDMQMAEVRPLHIQGILDTMRGQKSQLGTPFKPATIMRVFALAKLLFNWAIKMQIHEGLNPCNAIDAPRFDNRVTNPLTVEDVAKLKETLEAWKEGSGPGVGRSERPVLVIQFALYSGKRLGEILSLRWSDVDIKNGLVTFQGAMTKNGRTSTVPVNKTCLEILRKAKAIRKGEYVFPNSKGKRFVNFTHYWYRIRKKAGLDVKGYRFHDLRHTFASYLASSGEVDIYTLKELLGHRSLEMTQRYAHLTNGSLRKATNIMDKIF